MGRQPRACPFGNTWDLEVIGLCLAGVQRFDELQRELGISRKVLAERLKVLEAEGILERRRYQRGPDRFDYAPTTKGAALRHVVEAIAAWSASWSSAPTTPSQPA